MNSEISSIVKENVRYSNDWWSVTTKFTSFFSYTERFHTTTAMNLLEKMNLEGSFLDVGFGSGLLIKKLMRRKLTVVGLDISLSNIKCFRKNLRKNQPVYTLPIDPFHSELALKGDSVDGIVCSHVLEHVPDDSVLIKEMHRVLRPGGIAVILVPINEEDIDVPTHVRKYTKEKIVQKLSPYFEILESGSNDILSHYVSFFGVRKTFISTIIKRSLIFIFSFLPSKLAVAIDRFLIDNLRIKKRTSQVYILARKISRDSCNTDRSGV
ncbi:MAG: class I SAM-dependent methyltransferase [Fibrobacter sp.]|nr:class I SAM-dependent methyltransferase [Fibrobacter sp.]